MSTPDLPFVSVIVVTYQRGPLLVLTLRYLLQQDYPGRFEIIVIDQTEQVDEFTRQFLDAQRAAIQYVRHSPPRITTARNLGIAHARGAIVLFVDDDVILPRDFLTAHARAYDDPQVGAVAGRVVHLRQQDWGAPGRLTGTFDKHGYCSCGYSRTDRCYIEAPQGCNMSFRRSVIDQVGLFDPRLISLDDTDYGVRTRAAGFRILFEPDAWLAHLEAPGGSRLKRSYAEKRVRLFTDETLFFLKHYGPARFGDFLAARWKALVSPTLWRASWRSGRPQDVIAPWQGMVRAYQLYRQPPPLQVQRHEPQPDYVPHP